MEIFCLEIRREFLRTGHRYSVCLLNLYSFFPSLPFSFSILPALKREIVPGLYKNLKPVDILFSTNWMAAFLMPSSTVLFILFYGDLSFFLPDSSSEKLSTPSVHHPCTVRDNAILNEFWFFKYADNGRTS